MAADPALDTYTRASRKVALLMNQSKGRGTVIPTQTDDVFDVIA